MYALPRALRAGSRCVNGCNGGLNYEPGASRRWNDDMRAEGDRLDSPRACMTRVEFKGPKRTLDQNSRMWAMLTDVSRQQ